MIVRVSGNTGQNNEMYRNRHESAVPQCLKRLEEWSHAQAGSIQIGAQFPCHVFALIFSRKTKSSQSGRRIRSEGVRDACRSPLSSHGEVGQDLGMTRLLRATCLGSFVSSWEADWCHTSDKCGTGHIGDKLRRSVGSGDKI